LIFHKNYCIIFIERKKGKPQKVFHSIYYIVLENLRGIFHKGDAYAIAEAGSTFP